MTICPVHARYAPPAGCEACRRMAAIGVLVDAALPYRNLVGPVERASRPGESFDATAVPGCVLERYGLEVLDALDSVAYLLTEHAKLVRAHRRERNEDAREAQRDARDAYSQGVQEGDAAAREDW